MHGSFGMLLYANMRTSIDIPDDLYRNLKARAATKGITLRTLILRLVEIGLRHQDSRRAPVSGRSEPPPVIIPPRGETIPALTRAQLRRLEEEEDEASYGGSAGR